MGIIYATEFHGIKLINVSFIERESFENMPAFLIPTILIPETVSVYQCSCDKLCQILNSMTAKVKTTSLPAILLRVHVHHRGII